MTNWLVQHITVEESNGIPWANAFMPGGLFETYQMAESICQPRGSWFCIYIYIFFFLYIQFFIFIAEKYPLFYVNSVDPDQTPCFTVADLLGLNRLLMSYLWDVTHEWVKEENAC